MKKSLIAISLAVCTIDFAHAKTSGFYAGAQLGRGSFKVDTENSDERIGDITSHKIIQDFALAGSVNLGYNFKQQFDVPIRTEISFTTRSTPKNSLEQNGFLKHRVRTLMLNNYYDLYTGGNFIPYISLGIGYARLKTTEGYQSEEVSIINKNFAYSLGLGTSYTLTDSWSADIVARATYNGKIKGEEVQNQTLKSSTYDIMLGVSYNF